MTDDTYSVKAVADLLRTSPESVRRYSKQFGRHLSTHARPPAGVERRFTQGDIQTLYWCKERLRDGLSWQEIDQALPLMTAEELPSWADVTGKSEDQPNESTALDIPGRFLTVLEHMADTSTVIERQQAELGQLRNELAELRAELAALKAATGGTAETGQRLTWWDRLTGRGPSP